MDRVLIPNACQNVRAVTDSGFDDRVDSLQSLLQHPIMIYKKFVVLGASRVANDGANNLQYY